MNQLIRLSPYLLKEGAISDQSDNNFDGEWIASQRKIVMFFLRRKWGLDKEDLEEVTQETMVAALQSFDKYEGRNNAVPGTYLMGIANNVAQSYFRKRSRHQRRTMPIEFAESIGTFFRDEAEANDMARLLKEKIAKLPKKYIQVLELVFYKGYKEGEAAKKLGIPPDKVYNYKSDAIKRLKKLCSRDPAVKSLFW